MKRFVVEKDFTHCGLRCVVVLQNMGHRCGYVGVPQGHNLFCQYADFDVIEMLEVHGGITYSGGGIESYYPVESDLWWFGFDCAHYMDLNDFDAALKAFDDAETQRSLLSYKHICEQYPDKHGVVRTLEYCVEQCKHLAEQLKEN